MDYLIIEGVKPYNGRYEFNLDGQEFTTREWGWIKRFSSYLPLTAADGFANNDAELMCALAVIMLRRAGRISTEDVPSVYETLADAPFTAALRWETSPTDDATGDDLVDPTASSNGNTGSSGTASATSSETSDNPSSPTGMPGSAISVSGPPTSGS
jgi:hypothetical protein